MKAIILAGGEGTRLREIAKDIPKPMVQVQGRPFMEYLVLQLANQGILDMVISVRHKKDIIKSYFEHGRRWGVNITYSEEEEPLGTGGALRKAFESDKDEQFIVMNGDSFFDLRFNRIIAFHEKHKSMATICLAYVEDTSRFGRVVINRKNKVIDFGEKMAHGSGIINAGVYVFNRLITDHIPDGKVSLEEKVLPSLIPCGLYGLIFKNYFIDMGQPHDYLRLCNHPERLIKGSIGQAFPNKGQIQS